MDQIETKDEARSHLHKEEPKAIKTDKKPFLPSARMLKTIEMQLELKRRTLEDIAIECGVTRMTLYRWQRNSDYQDLYLKRSWEVLRAFTPIANKSLQIAILKQDVQALKLFYQLTENIRESMEITFSFGGDKRNG